MNPLDSYLGRLKATGLNSNAELHSYLEAITEENIEILIQELESSVSFGHFGLAAELSDRLLTDGVYLLDDTPGRRVRVELERVKRLCYCGYTKATIRAVERTLSALENTRTHIPEREFALWSYTALGYKAWVVESDEQLKGILLGCDAMIANISSADPLHTECLAFLHGIKGRYSCLCHRLEQTIQEFGHAISLVPGPRYVRSRLHLEVLYAEHLAALEQWGEALALAKRLIDYTLSLTIKTHLTLRTILLILRAPRDLIDPDELDLLRARAQLLVHAAGLSQSTRVSPLLAGAIGVMAANWGDSIYEYDIREGLERLLRALDWERMEVFVANFYRAKGYEVRELPKGSPAFDMIVQTRQEDGAFVCTAIQVKHWQSGSLTKSEIPGIEVFEQAQKYITEMELPQPQFLHWYCTSGIYHEALAKLKSHARHVFGVSCKVNEIGLQQFLTELLRNYSRLQTQSLLPPYL